jgi:hypothetical protein
MHLHKFLKKRVLMRKIIAFIVSGYSETCCMTDAQRFITCATAGFDAKWSVQVLPPFLFGKEKQELEKPEHPHILLPNSEYGSEQPSSTAKKNTLR